MKLIDTHTHVYLPEFDGDRDEVIERAAENGVEKLLMPNIDTDSVERMLSVQESYPGICFPMIGLHPASVKEDFAVQLEKIKNLVTGKKFYAIGEIGIDLYWDKTYIKEQIAVFKKQVEFAIGTGMPVVIHSRNSFPEIFSALEEYRETGIKGVFHAFTGTSEDAEKAISMGFMLGIGGIVTFKNSGLDKVVKEAGPGHLVLETDSPYLAPVPYRGKRNESSYICIVNRKLAEIFSLTGEEMAEITYRNSAELFGL
jgi:TatD DNase family protein